MKAQFSPEPRRAWNWTGVTLSALVGAWLGMIVGNSVFIEAPDEGLQTRLHIDTHHAK